MTEWSMTVQVDDDAATLVAAHDAEDGVEVGPGPVDVDPAGERVDALAEALAALVRGTGRPTGPRHLRVVTGAEADRAVFTDLDEAAALAGLPAPLWLPEPVAVAGHRLADRLAAGDAAVVLDVRDGGLTAWPLGRTADGVEVAGGPVAVDEQVDALLAGVARWTTPGDGPDADAAVARTPDDARRAAATLRRDVRRARRRLAAEDVDEVDVALGDGARGRVTREVFERAVTGALGEAMDALAGRRRVAVEVVAAGPTPLASVVCDLVGSVPAVPDAPYAAVLGAALLGLAPPTWEDDAGDEVPADEVPADEFPADEQDTDGRGWTWPAAQDDPVPDVPAPAPAPDDRPRWAVPALAASLVVAVVAAVGVLLLGPRPEASAPAPPPPVPVVVAAGGAAGPGVSP